MGSGCINPCNLDLGTTGEDSFTPRPLYLQGKGPWYPLDRRLGGLQSRSGRCGEENNLNLSALEHGSFGRPGRSQSLCRIYLFIYSITNKLTTLSIA
jgi:hypothetical protein